MGKKHSQVALDHVPRIPPYSEESERGVLGTILLNDKFVRKCIRKNLCAESFFVPRHRIIYESILSVQAKKYAIDLTTVTTELKSQSALEQIGGVRELELLIDKTPTATNGEYYLDIVLQKAKARELLLVCSQTMDTVYENGQHIEDLISQAKFSFHKIGYLRERLHDKSEIVAGLIAGYRQAEKTGSIGVTSRWHDYQKRIIGYMKGKPSIVAAGPGQGKSTVGMNEALHKALNGIPALIISIEMEEWEIIERMIGDLLGFNMALPKRGLATSEQIHQIHLMGQFLNQLPLYVEDKIATAEQIAATIREYVEEKGVQFVVIDYVQLILPSPGQKFANRNLELTHASQLLVHVAKETGVHILELSQLSRGYKNDKSFEPDLHHLRDSGSLEQDAYMVTFVYRDPDCDEDWDDDQPTIFKVGKHRGGPVSKTYMTFQKTKQRFVGKDNFVLNPATWKPKEPEHEVNDSEDEVPF